MKIIIDIPEKEYQACVRRDANMTGGIADSYIANGTVLPEDKGRLVYARDVKNALLKSCGDVIFTDNKNQLIGIIGNVPTAIGSNGGAGK